MKRRIILLLLLLSTLTPTFCRAGEIYGVSPEALDFYAGDQYLSKWLVPEARAEVDKLLAKNPHSVAALLADAHVSFFEGRYKRSLEQLEKTGFRGGFKELVATTWNATREMKSRKSANFEVFWSDPRDELLADDALLTLEAAREALGKALGYLPPGPVRLEIYPTTADFTAVSTLTRREVDTTGIIGLCKFDRLLITSPRVALWGYRWRDTISHEYIHLVVYRLSGGDAPIWLHEGIAKYLEGSWRGRVGRPDPDSLALLADRLAKNTLIGLDQMSPSIAKLPSAEDAELAFTEVETMMNFLVLAKGREALPKALTLIAEGQSDRKALEAVWGGTFADFEEKWRKWAATLPKLDGPLELVGLELSEGKEDSETSVEKVADAHARDYVRLGDMLRGRGRMSAAAQEYAKAYDAAPKSPTVAGRHALGRITEKDYGAAVAAIDGVLDLYGDMAVLWARKGEALFELGRLDEAKAALTELMDINPFHVPGRLGLLAIAEKQGNAVAREREHAAVKLIYDGGANTMPPDHGPKAKER